MIKAMKNQLLVDLRTCSAQELKVLKQEQDYFCVYCKKPMYIKSGPKRKAHFAHVTSCEFLGSEPESEAHYQAKKMLAQWLQEQGIQVEMEYGFSKIKRIADLYFVWDTKQYVIEIQKSSLSGQVFQQRTQDYESLNITILWVFIGELAEKRQTFILNSVMTLNQEFPLIYLNVDAKKLWRFDQIIWISTKEIYARSQIDQLENLRFSQLLVFNQQTDMKTSETWFEIKAEFRQRRWQAYMKQERALCQICNKYGINLALLPAEVGWPVTGKGFGKALFIWQAYILMIIVLSYQVGDSFTLQDLIKKLKTYYGLAVTSKSLLQLKDYLKILVNFRILIYEYSYYEYKKKPSFYGRLEQVLSDDYQLGLQFFQEGE